MKFEITVVEDLDGTLIDVEVTDVAFVMLVLLGANVLVVVVFGANVEFEDPLIVVVLEVVEVFKGVLDVEVTLNIGVDVAAEEVGPSDVADVEFMYVLEFDGVKDERVVEVLVTVLAVVVVVAANVVVIFAVEDDIVELETKLVQFFPSLLGDE